MLSVKDRARQPLHPEHSKLMAFLKNDTAIPGYYRHVIQTFFKYLESKGQNFTQLKFNTPELENIVNEYMKPASSYKYMHALLNRLFNLSLCRIK